MQVNCPTCRKLIVWSSENPHRPFCCERCKLIDLGEWAAEDKRIPGEVALEALEFMDEEQLLQVVAEMQAKGEGAEPL